MELATHKVWNVTEDTDLFLLGSTLLSLHWEQAAEMLGHADEELFTTYSLGDIYNMVAAHRMQLWLAKEKGEPKWACLTELIQYPHKRVLHFLHLGGVDISGFLKYLEWIKQWGLAMGCDEMKAECRPAIAKMLAEQGFENQGIVMSAPLVANERIH